MSIFKVSIEPQWKIRHGERDVLVTKLLHLLVAIAEHGNLAHACRALGTSYRYAWGLLQEGEERFGVPLVTGGRGKGSQLTQLGEKLVWADRRIGARLGPVLASLASELEAEIEAEIDASRSTVPTLLRLHASHGYAIAALQEALANFEVPVEFKYRPSMEALASLAAKTCEIAGFPIPTGRFELEALSHYSRWLIPDGVALIHVAVRRQGLIVAHGNPKKIYRLGDLARADVRFINREKDSGTRLLIDMLMKEDGVEPTSVKGYADVEYTHAAVAAYIASGRADAGIGVETPARRFDLEFMPLESERYFLACRIDALETAAIRRLITVLSSAQYQARVNDLPGYQAAQSGLVQSVAEAFPALNPV